MNARPAVVRPLASSASAARDASAPTRAARPRLAAAAPRKPRLSVKRRAAKPVCPGLIRVHGSYVPSMSGHTNVTELRSTAPKHCSGETPVSASSARAGHGCETRRPSPPAPLVPVRAVGGPPAPAARPPWTGRPAVTGPRAHVHSRSHGDNTDTPVSSDLEGPAKTHADTGGTCTLRTDGGTGRESTFVLIDMIMGRYWGHVHHSVTMDGNI